MQQTIIQQKTSYTSAWIFLIIGLFIWPFLIVSIILFIVKSSSAPKTVKVIVQDDNATQNNNIIAEHSEK